jgi:Pseudouridylate synthases, 23S RNA-specific
LKTPILSDSKYASRIPKEYEYILEVKRLPLHLHARKITFLGANKKMVTITAPLPEHFKSTLKVLDISEKQSILAESLRSPPPPVYVPPSKSFGYKK